MQRVPESSVEVHFDGRIEEQWHDQYHSVRHKDYTTITAIPYDICIAGMDGKGVSLLRVWKAENDKFDMKLFNGGNYMRAMEQQAMAETITKVLYPEDNHTDGKLLRLSQQYFLVSASIQDIIRRHLMTHGNLDELPNLAAIHLNDTHPVLAIPEMMRVMLDECGYGWDAAWDIVKRTVAYTNHTVMSEALETWNRDLFKMRLPRIYQIVEEIDRRFWNEMRAKGVDEGKIFRMAPLNDGYVKMASLAVIGSHSVNGVSALHSEILKNDLFHDFYLEEPQKFTNVTNGIAHRRWLNQSNPELAKLITQLIGKDYIYDADKLQGPAEIPGRRPGAGAAAEDQAGQQGAPGRLPEKDPGRRGGPRLHLRRAGQAPPRVQAPAHERPEHPGHLPVAAGESQCRLHPPHLPVRRQSRGGVLLSPSRSSSSSPPWPSRSILTPG